MSQLGYLWSLDHLHTNSGPLIPFKIQDSKAFIRQCTDINHINQRNNVKKRIKYFLMSTCPETLVKAVWPLSQRPPENVWKYWVH